LLAVDEKLFLLPSCRGVFSPASSSSSDPEDPPPFPVFVPPLPLFDGKGSTLQQEHMESDSWRAATAAEGGVAVVVALVLTTVTGTYGGTWRHMLGDMCLG